MKLFLDYFEKLNSLNSNILKLIALILMAVLINMSHGAEEPEMEICQGPALDHKVSQAKNLSKRIPAGDYEAKFSNDNRGNSFQVLSYQYNAEGIPEISKGE